MELDLNTILVNQLYPLLVLSVVVSSVSWTLTQEEIFREFRKICVHRIKESPRLLERKFFYLFTCEYCFSHWVTAVVIIGTGFRLLFDDWRGYVVAFFVLPWIANQMMSIYRRLRVSIKYENTLAEKEKQEIEK